MSTFKYLDPSSGKSVEYEAPDDSSYAQLKTLGKQAMDRQGSESHDQPVEKATPFEDTNNNVITKPRAHSLPGVMMDAGGAVLSGAAALKDKVDQYAQAPNKSALMSAIKNIKSGDFGAVLPEAGAAYKNQFGQPTDQAPRGKEIAQELGLDGAPSGAFPEFYTDAKEGPSKGWLPEDWRLKKGGMFDPTVSGTAGLGIDMATDLTNYIPGKKVWDAGKKAYSEVANFYSGMPKADILNYLMRNKKVKERMETFGTDTMRHADTVKERMVKSIWEQKDKLNDQVDATLAKYKNLNGSVEPILQSLKDSQSKLIPTVNGKEIAEIQNLMSRIEEGAKNSIHSYPQPVGNVQGLLAQPVPSNVVGLDELYAWKKELQDLGTKAYIKPGAIKAVDSAGPIDFAARDAGRAARMEIKKIIARQAEALESVISIIPDGLKKEKYMKDLDVLLGLEKANKEQSILHTLYSKHVNSLLKPGAPYEQLLQAGSGRSPVGQTALNRLGRFANDDFAQKAADFSSATSMSNTPMLPIDRGGKGAMRYALSGLVPGLIAGKIAGPEVGVGVGLAVAGVSASPKTTRLGANMLLSGEKHFGKANVAARMYNTAQGKSAQNPEDVIALLNRDASTADAAEMLRVARQKGDKSYAAALYLLTQSNPKVGEAIRNANK